MATIFLLVVVGLVVVSVGSTGTFYMTVDELALKKVKAEGKPIKLSGKIVGDSIDWNPEEITLTFDLRGEYENDETVTVVYKGVKPDSMNDGWEAIVEGELSPEGTLEATELLVKCPSKYEALEEEGEELPEDHQSFEQQEEGSDK